MEEPVCLIENKGTFVANPEAISILSKVNQPVVVVAIVGLYRTGKSYLMNKLAGGTKGFGLGYSIEAKTKGTWMWCIPHPTKKNHMLVLLDTEGLGDGVKGNDKNDSWLFCLAILLSSVLVYNCKNAIDQDALEKLKFTEEITQLIKVKSQNNKDEKAEFSRHFPMFIWVVRDFLLQLQIDGKPVSEDEYMENALMLKTSANTKKEEEFNKLRESLRMYFGCRKCFVFDFPSFDVEDLPRLEDIPENNLNAKFTSQCNKFCNYIFNKAEEKRVQDTVTVTGKRLGELVKFYVDAINSSKFACMEDAVLSLSEKENIAATDEAVQHYKDKMKMVKLPTETLENFLDLSKQYEDEAQKIFLKRSFKDKDEQFLKKFALWGPSHKGHKTSLSIKFFTPT
ncbi:guanylate-binding protein 3-like, partial [Hyperolius riggenbachi]|uniref:guanylate-binding protein 3-like n=1 Tax=Hyperolius riggenbachi TaxID=752182 RepID=UPI0035A2D1BD